MSDKLRLDQLLVEKGIVNTRSKAKQLIEAGQVQVDGVIRKKASQNTKTDANIVLTIDEVFVGRGAHKLKGALKSFLVTPATKVCADIGASTGGFTQILLDQGATKVYAIDVGHDQLDATLKDDSRVINLEGINVKNPIDIEELVDLAVIDVSFISLRLCLPQVYKILKDGGQIIALVKPQFEAGRERIGKGGIIKDSQVHGDVLNELIEWCGDQSFYIRDLDISPIQGTKGNTEFFFHFDLALTCHTPGLIEKSAKFLSN